MTIITLTRQDTPSRPVTLNTDFIAAVNPLRKVVPDANSQTNQAKTVYMGTEVILSNGTKYNVIEAYPDVVDRLNSASAPFYSTESMPDADAPAPVLTAAPRPPAGSVLAASGVAQMANTVTPTEVPESFPELQSPAVLEPTTMEHPLPPGDDTLKTWEPPAGTPLTEDELKAVAEHDAKPDLGTNPPSGDDDVITKYGDERSAPEPTPPPAKKVSPLKGVKRAGTGPKAEVRVEPSPTEHSPEVTTDE